VEQVGEPPSGTRRGDRAAPWRPTAATRWSLVGLTAVLLLVADQITKALAFDRLCEQPDGYACLLHAEPVDVVWTLRFNLAFNTGMAFSRGAGAGPIIAAVVIVIVVVLLIVARRLHSRLQLVLVGVVVGGALGNLVDRIVRAEDGLLSGAVVDFIDVQWWPIFNIADAAVVVGGIALALTGLGTDHDHDSGPDGATGPGDGTGPDGDAEPASHGAAMDPAAASSDADAAVPGQGDDPAGAVGPDGTAAEDTRRG
jgi:signal peptidase II